MIQQHAGNSLVFKPLAHLTPEGFSQDKVFKAHAFTQGDRHPVTKLCTAQLPTGHRPALCLRRFLPFLGIYLAIQRMLL